MLACWHCGGELRHVHRRLHEKWFCTAVYTCAECKLRIRCLRRWPTSDICFVFSKNTSCIRCGTSEVERLSKKDHIDPVSRHFFSLLFRVLGAPVNECHFCRLQYYDFRPIRSKQAETSANT